MLDLAIIGGGPAGYVAAERAAHAGLSACVIEKNALGGVCLNEGCIPSKALLCSVKVLESAQTASQYGVEVPSARLDHAAVVARKRRVVRQLVSGVTASVKASGAQILKGSARVRGRIPGGFALDVDTESAAQTLEARNVLIATGSEPILPPLPGVAEGLQEGTILTSREALELPAVPPTLAVIGGGVIGLEMAAYYAAAGSKVHIIEMLDHIGGPVEAETSAALQKALAALGIEFHLGAKLLAHAPGRVRCASPEGEFGVPADATLMSVGRRPVTSGLGLEALGVELRRGGLPTDTRGRTNQPGIYAAGDVNGLSMLAHTAYREAEVCVNSLLGVPDRMRYTAIPSVIYTHPEAASVGHTRASARALGLDFESAQISMRYSGRFVAENDHGDGFVLVHVERGTRRLLGVHIVGPYASEMIYGAAALIEMELRVEDVRQIVFPHPTVSELLREVMFSI